MTITIPPLDVEQQAAASQISESFGSVEQWAANVITGLIEERVLHNINAKGAALLEAVKQLPKEKRLDYTDRAETLLVTIATQD
jgi:hypothetical protein